MSKLLKNTLIGICGLIIILVTISTFFLLDYNSSKTGNIGLAFMVFSEIVLISGMLIIISIKNLPNSLFLKIGLIGSLSIYFITTGILLILSEIFMEAVNTFIVLQIVALSATIILAIVFVLLGIRINEKDQSIYTSRKLIQICEKRIYDLMVNFKNSKYEGQIFILYEKVKYGDKLGISSVDEKIVGAIIKLENELKADNINDEIFNEISTLITQRNNEISEQKRGGF